MNRFKIPPLLLLILFCSCLANNTAIESEISKRITYGLNMKKFPNHEDLYPKGKYETIRDFNLKTPNSNIDFNKSQLKHLISANYQLKDSNGKRIKYPFAVSNGNELFVNVKRLEKTLNTKNKMKLSNANNDFLRAYFLNSDFVYFETEMISEYIVITKFKRTGILYCNRKNEFVVFDNNSKVLNFLNENFSEFKNNIFSNNEERP